MVRVDAEQETRERHSHELIEGLTQQKSRLLVCAASVRVRVRVRNWEKFPSIIQTEMQMERQAGLSFNLKRPQ